MGRCVRNLGFRGLGLRVPYLIKREPRFLVDIDVREDREEPGGALYVHFPKYLLLSYPSVSDHPSQPLGTA